MIQPALFRFPCGKLNFRNHSHQEANVAEKLKRVVYVEDEQEMIDLVRLILSRKGFEVTGANGGREGLATIRRVLPDLVLLDLMMPDMDGWDVYQQMKAEDATREIPVIIVTAKAQSIDKVLGLHIAKVDDYIAKPFSPNELVLSVEKVLARRRESA
jgi:DNA-binding response OmpR family regulator